MIFMNQIRMKLPRSADSRKGAAVIEFAIIIPVFMLLVLGTIETCNMIFLQQSLEIAAYEAARVTLIPSADTADVNTAATQILVPRRVNNATIAVTPVNFRTAAYGTFIKVEVSAPCANNSVFPLRFYGSRTLKGTVEMMME